MISSLIGITLLVWIIYKVVFARKNPLHGFLLSELPKWEERKFIAPEQTEQILAFYNLKRRAPVKIEAIKVLSFIGAAFVGLGAIFFVASNWQHIPAHLKTAILLGVTFSTLYSGYYVRYERQGLIVLGDALLFLACLFWGGSIALIAQIYNLPVSDNWKIFLLWAFPVLPVALVFKNKPVYLLASALFLIWHFVFQTEERAQNFWYPLIVCALLLPFLRGFTAGRWFNLAGLLAAAVVAAFFHYHWLILAIGLAIIVYKFIIPQEPFWLLVSSLVFIAWACSFFGIERSVANVYFLFPLAFLFYLSYRDNDAASLTANLVSFLIWSGYLYWSFSGLFGYAFSGADIVLIVLFLGALIFASGIYSKHHGYPMSSMYRALGFLAVFAGVYLLSFEGVVREISLKNNPLLPSGLFLCAAAVFGLLIADRKDMTKGKASLLEGGALCGALFGGLIIVSGVPAVAAAVIGNILLLGVALACTFVGVELQDGMVFNLGTVAFVLLIVTRYIDTAWKLLDKSLFFVIGGLLMLGLGVLVQKQRARLLKRTEAA